FGPDGFWRQGASVVVAPNTTTTYTVVGVSAQGCSNDRTQSVAVEFYEPDFGPVTRKDTVAVGTPVEFEDRTPGATHRLWDFGGGAMYESARATHVFDTLGVFPVVLVTGSQNCSTRDTLWITVVQSLARSRSVVRNPKVYPNPTDGTLWMEFDAPVAVRAALLGSTGQLAAEFDAPADRRHRWRLPQRLADGLYLLRIATDDGTIAHHKIEIQR
ncbi:MAG: T9SS type A sorting domain-containing protein, partial [Bacteroidia bacterium]|nr:T9SS type A sorting domain-containing protein [Bacteroidia bacterium]